MTDTTDIAALRNKFGTKLPTSDDAKEKFIELLSAPHACSWFLAPYAIAFLDALEAERQRADGLQSTVGRLAQESNKLFDDRQRINKSWTEAETNNALLRDEIAALKGDQVPVAWIRERAIDKPEHKGKVWRDISYPVKPEPAAVDGVYHDVIIPLYDRPQKPVVLPSLTIGEVMHRSGYDRQYAEGWVSANDNAIREIKAAGGIVKDGE